MAAGGDPFVASTGRKSFFVGVQTVATVDSIDLWLRGAKRGDEFTYCEAAEPIRRDSWFRARELEQAGLVHMRQSKRAGGGYRWFVIRTAKALRREPSPQEKALDDPKTKAIFDILVRAANMGDPCPSDAENGRKVGLDRTQATWRFRRLVQVELIESQVAYEDGVPRRVVTIRKTGKRTALPPKWQALEDAARKDAPPSSAPPVPARQSFPGRRGGAL